MNLNNMQCTLKNSFSFKGEGVHSGIVSEVVVKPAKENTWFVFDRIDLKDEPTILAHVNNVISTERCTTIGHNNNNKVSTVEHLLAALYSMGIDNAIIEINGPEVPILDGSSIKFVDLIKKSGIIKQNVKRNVIKIEQTIYNEDNDGFSKIIIFPSVKTSYETYIDFKSNSIGTQYFKLDNIEDFEKEIANCRTFCLYKEIKPLVEKKLLQSKNIHNGIVFIEQKLEGKELENALSILTPERKKAFLQKEEKTILNTELRHKNEPARHKLLDVIGDLTLLGKRLSGRVIAYGPGHKLNCSVAKKIVSQININKDKVPQVNINQTSIYSQEEIKKLLPHRFPFLFVDKILEIGEDSVIGTKNVTGNEWYFKGHFPNEPILPGVIQLETMAQIGGILVLNQLDKRNSYSTYFLKIEEAKFKRKVIPGDILVVKMKFLSPFRRGIAHMKGLAYVGKNLVSEASMIAQIVKNK